MSRSLSFVSASFRRAVADLSSFLLSFSLPFSDTYSPFNPLTDVPDPQTGLIDGVPAIQEQNGKITILSTAETYIQHLTKERERIDWEKTALEEFVRKMDGGEAAWKKWRTVSSETELSATVESDASC